MGQGKEHQIGKALFIDNHNLLTLPATSDQRMLCLENMATFHSFGDTTESCAANINTSLSSSPIGYDSVD